MDSPIFTFGIRPYDRSSTVSIFVFTYFFDGSFFHISLFKFIDRKRFKRGLKVVNFILKINLNKNYEKGVDLWKVKK